MTEYCFSSWQYTCVDLAQLIMTARPSYRKLKLTKLYIYRNGTDVYVDSVFIGFKEPTTDFAGEFLSCKPKPESTSNEGMHNKYMYYNCYYVVNMIF